MSTSNSDELWLEVPELAAFRCGRLVNQIQHQTQVLWLLGTEQSGDGSTGFCECSNFSLPWRQLRLGIRPLLTHERERHTFEQIVNAAKADWENRFGTLAHHELLINQNEQIEVERLHSESEAEGPSLEEIVARRCQLLLGSVDEIISSIADFIWASFDSRNLEFYQLGIQVDRIIHPVPAVAELIAHQSESEYNSQTRDELQPEYNPFQSSLPSDYEESVDPNSEMSFQTAPWRLPTTPLALSRCTELWFEEFTIRARGCGLGIDGLIRQITEVEQASGDLRVGLGQVVELIETAVSVGTIHRGRSDIANVSESSETPIGDDDDQDQWSTTKIGLEFNVHDRMIRNAQTNETTPVPNGLTFRVLKYLADRGQRPTFKHELEDEWENFSGNETPQSRSAISNRISKAKKEISRLGFTILSDGRGRDLSWCLARSELDAN